MLCNRVAGMVEKLRAPMLAIALTTATPLAGAAADDAAILARSEAAYVAHDESGTAWTIGNGDVRFKVGLTAAGALVAEGLDRPGSEDVWPIGHSADFSFVNLTRRLSPGQSGFPFRSATADEYRGGVRLRLVFDDTTARLRVTRSYVCYPTAPVIETWSTFEVLDGAAGVSVSDLGVWQLSVPVTEVNWVTGLKATAADGGRFTRRRQALGPGTPFELGSTVRSSETAIPTVWFRGGSTQFFAGLLWSGAWKLTATGPTTTGLTAIRMAAGSTATTVRRGEPLDTPHGIFGVVGDAEASVTLALQQYVLGGLRGGRPIDPLVTYNTWFAYGIDIDDASMRAEMGYAAALGVELFVVDAGWYAGGTQVSDFTTGLGTWAADARRFPAGLKSLRDHAHALGMKFGIWVEPERVATTTVGRAGLARERFLATAGGRYNAGVKNEHAADAQICLGDGEARQWLLAQLTRFIDDVQPDYLKWDNNYWINCDRTSHGHGTQDGNFAHTRGLYEVLEVIRARYPDLVIENCAAGGNRLDLGMLQYSDVGWMDDVTAPSAHVRHNLEGLGAVLPAEYLLSFVTDDPAEPIHNAADMPLYFRSRMAGVLGLTLRGSEFGESDTEAMRREVALYKTLRSAVPDMTLLLLSDQVNGTGNGAWDVVQGLSPDSPGIVLFAFAGPGSDGRVTVRLQRLIEGARYAVVSPRGRTLVETSGALLMQDGVGLWRSSFSDGQVLQVTPVGPPAPVR